MAWFLALQGPAHQTHQSSAYELQDAVDIEKLAQELTSAVTLDRVVPVPAMLPQAKGRRQKVTLYVRPAAWGLWTFYQLSEEEQRALVNENPLLNALAQTVAQRAQGASAAQNPFLGQPPR
ncbi:hypothetical protein [Mycolicibacterium holsaticum]|jgi:hypothetical protein|uniref:Uncharacterized protein n=1 Tax=Mycolicibacterium holsaticum TaxID=152142 RepID=A0A1E3R502_9MYCO|nr:hypothetical protein [Mycolicibacterium holsaticum]NLG55072.1 hypothetical protein [Rhodococcus sp. (in: high G+C Gram-positive bacteria)]MDA4105681.1 hypothetical protein [Mycolicibacterium holsaticum DSM 44478 = JCM 12374]ODQ84995.1 hypothetical protein BHQ17_24985 [Mycolicibacterium holsaticum]QZA13943.1 hypothetical protein K3U96_07415 [Mycolicibacterium holsaticum DSM 44478 = JCM 12374]UNC08596.1 hypothetical protein H5U41_19415 [Mycolicibacterium holsaticum DSM 44478 = JCM 12374]